MSLIYLTKIHYVNRTALKKHCFQWKDPCMSNAGLHIIHEHTLFMVLIGMGMNFNNSFVMFCLFIYPSLNKQNVKKVYDKNIHSTFRESIHTFKYLKTA